MIGVRVDRGLGILLGSDGFCWVLGVSMGAVQKVWVKTLHQDVAGKKKILRGSRSY